SMLVLGSRFWVLGSVRGSRFWVRVRNAESGQRVFACEPRTRNPEPNPAPRTQNPEPYRYRYHLLQLRFQHPPELLLRAIQLGLHSAQRKLQRLGELFVSRAVKVVRGDEEPVVRGQADDGFLQAVPQLEIAESPIRHRRHRSPAHAIVVK